jgi:hypothetical protein
MWWFLRLAVTILTSTQVALLFAATLEITVADKVGKQLPCRIHLTDAAGTAQLAEGLPFWKDHFVCPGFVALQLETGKYHFEIERGPEYLPAVGSVELPDGEQKKLTISLHRIANLAKRGWWSGELHVHRAIDEVPLHLRAEDLHVAPVITWWNGRDLWRDRPLPKTTLMKVDADRYYDVMAGEDEREGGALMYFGLKKPLPLPGGKSAFAEHPSPMKFVELAGRHKDVSIDIEKPFWWDTPIWLASGQTNSIGLANNHMCRSSMFETEAWGKPRDEQRLPPPRGNGYWTQELYYHVLECGLRVPPSAGSASGVLPNPVGYNRVYVYLGSDFSYHAWWQGLRAGRSFVTNGPLLFCQANGQRPGHVFQAERSLETNLNIELISNDHVPALEIIKNGRTVQTIPIDGSDKSQRTAKLTFQESGWFLVRAVAENRRTFRFASTAPYYVEIGNTKSRISRRSVQFFLDWIDERAARVPQKLKDPARLSEVLKYHGDAKRFWRQRMSQANAE